MLFFFRSYTHIRYQYISVYFDKSADSVHIIPQIGHRQTERFRARLDSADRLLATLGHEATLARGYALVWSDGALVTNVKQAQAAPALDIQFADGRVSTGARAAPRRKSKAPDPDQGNLF